jgi:uncharacterized protein (DUF2062 family)
MSPKPPDGNLSLKKLLEKYLPSPESFRQRRSFRFLGDLLGDPRLWHLNRHTIPGATFIGIFVCLLPMPFHMLVAAFLAVKFRCNLPLAAMLTWVNSPITYVPVFYFNYRIGTLLMGEGHPTTPHHIHFAWLVSQLTPLWLGSFVCATLAGGAAYLLTKLGWRLSIMRSWQRRQHRPH